MVIHSNDSRSGATVTPLIYGTFLLGEDEFAIAMEDLQEVVNAPDKLQKMPLSPTYLLGLFNLRGTVLPVVDLRILLKADSLHSEAKLNCRMVVMRSEGVFIGLVFDAVGEVLRVKQNDLIPIARRDLPNDLGMVPVSAVISRNEGRQVIQVLDLKALLTIRNLPLIGRLTSGRELNQNLTSRMRDLYREKLIGFSAGECHLAIEMKCVVAIIRNTGKRPSPCRSELCSSVILFHGRLVPVIELSGLLKLPISDSPRHILICVMGSDQIGLEVDEITSIIPYAKEKILPIPVLEKHRASIFHGCFTDRDGKDFIVLNEEGILSNGEITSITVRHHTLLEQNLSAEAAAPAKPLVSLLTFRIGKLYGIRLLDVVEVLLSPNDLMVAPSMPAAVLGILNLRGTPISVVDSRRLFELGESDKCSDFRLLIFQYQNQKIAMRVDSVESIIPVSAGVDSDLPSIFFHDDEIHLKNTFERGVQVVSKGEKSAVIVLSSEQIAKRLSEALAA